MNEKKKLYVANINYDADDNDLEDHFSIYGLVKNAQIILDQTTEESRGFGFVEMESERDAQKALVADGTEMMGRTLKVSYARSKGGSHGSSRGKGHPEVA